jgi:hypothetical protein
LPTIASFHAWISARFRNVRVPRPLRYNRPGMGRRDYADPVPTVRQGRAAAVVTTGTGL